MKFPLWRLLVVLAPCGPGHATEVALAPTGPVRLWQRAEFVVTGVPPAQNNFDPDEIRLDAEVTPPSGAKMTVPAFWTEDYTSRRTGTAEELTPTGGSGWRLRCLPTEPGHYSVALTLARAGVATRTVSTAGFEVTGPPPAGHHGWIRVAADHRGFETSDGSPFRVVGENLCWATAGGTIDYETWFDEVQRSGQNVVRVWMCPWWLALEQLPAAPNHYRMDAAWRLDRLFELAEERGLYLVLCLDFHGMLQVDNPNWGGSGNLWTRNPYQQNQGGPCAQPNDFFTDPRARALYAKRLRYLVARYSATTHLFAWQFFNEIDNVYAPHLLQAPDVAAWHGEMGRWLKANDPGRHLVTTSLTGNSDRPEIWSLPEMDFAVYHSYNDPAPAKRLARLADDYLSRYRKPVLIGEYGVDWHGWGGRTLDPHLRAQRQALWGTALSGAAGTALSWWWEEIRADGVYPLYAALTSVLARGGWPEGGWLPARVAPASDQAPAAVGEPRADGAVYTGPIALNDAGRLKLPNEAAVTGELSARRAAETLSGLQRGTAQPEGRKPLRLDAWWAAGASLQIRIADVAGAAEFVARIDGTEAARRAIPRPPPEAFRGRTAKVNVEVTLPVAAGHHRIEFENVGEQLLIIDHLQATGLRESAFAGGWRYEIEVNALRRDDRAILYAVSPWAVYPASATAYRPPLQTDQHITLLDWPDGPYEVTWYDPETGAELGRNVVAAAGGAVTLACPPFVADLAAIVRRGAR